MDPIFPMNLPSPTIWYVLLYIATLLLHLLFMSYVLVGAMILGVAGLTGKLGQAGPSPWTGLIGIFKDWMPLALSATITAGIAPLLFVQILYQQEFYTANLLMFHRWMAILPVLIVAFYMLYVLKAHRLEGRVWIQSLVALLIMTSIAFVAWSWIENHLLSIDRDAWAPQYQSGSMVYASSSIAPRLAMWIFAALPVAGSAVLWQIRAGASGTHPRLAADVARLIASVAGFASVAAAALAWPVIQHAAAPSDTTSRPWLILATLAAAMGGSLWCVIAVRRPTAAGVLTLASAASGLFWLGVLIAREAARWSRIGGSELTTRHSQVGTVAGAAVFVAVTVIAIVVVGWILVRVRRSLPAR